MKLPAPIAWNVIRQFRKTVDFYYWRGIPCARAWPRHTTQPNSPGQLRARGHMAQTLALIKASPPGWKDLWKNTERPTRRTYNDCRRKCILWLLAADRIVSIPDIIGLAAYPWPSTGNTYIVIHYEQYPGFDDRPIVWRIQAYDTTPPLMQWVQGNTRHDRERYAIENVWPDMTPWPFPDSTVIDRDSHQWILTVKGLAPHYAVLATTQEV